MLYFPFLLHFYMMWWSWSSYHLFFLHIRKKIIIIIIFITSNFIIIEAYHFIYKSCTLYFADFVLECERGGGGWCRRRVVCAIFTNFTHRHTHTTHKVKWIHIWAFFWCVHHYHHQHHHHPWWTAICFTLAYYYYNAAELTWLVSLREEQMQRRE